MSADSTLRLVVLRAARAVIAHGLTDPEKRAAIVARLGTEEAESFSAATAAEIEQLIAELEMPPPEA